MAVRLGIRVRWLGEDLGLAGEARAGGGPRGAAEGGVVPEAWIDEGVEASAAGDPGFDLSCRTLVAQVAG